MTSKIVGNRKYKISRGTICWTLEWRERTWGAWFGQDWNIVKTAQTKEEIKLHFDKV